MHPLIFYRVNKLCYTILYYQTSLSSSPGGNVSSSDGKFAHERLEWLKEENRKLV